MLDKYHRYIWIVHTRWRVPRVRAARASWALGS